MAKIIDHDPILQSLRENLRAQMVALNELHHPVYPSNPKRIAEFEALIAELRSAISARRATLTPASTTGPQPAPSTTRNEPAMQPGASASPQATKA